MKSLLLAFLTCSLFLPAGGAAPPSHPVEDYVGASNSAGKNSHEWASQAHLPEDYLSRLRVSALSWQAELPALKKSAAAAAEKVMAGGHLYIAGTQKSWISEACGRSGGLILAKPLGAATPVEANDVILAAATRGEEEAASGIDALLQRAEASGAQIVLFSNTVRPSGKQLTVFPTRNIDAPRPYVPGAVKNGRLPEKSGPAQPFFATSTESASNVIGLWSWTGEFVAACIRHGKMPCLFESNAMPGGKDRNALLRATPFHANNIVHQDPVPDLGALYLARLSAALVELAGKNGGAFEKAAALLKTSHEHGQPVSVMSIAHMFPAEMASNPVPAWIAAAPRNAPSPGALVFYLGYQWFPWEVEALTGAERGPSIITSVRHPTPDWVQDANHVYIDPCWETPDAVVKIPGYDIPVFPISGVVQSAIFWQLVEQAQKF